MKIKTDFKEYLKVPKKYQVTYSKEYISSYNEDLKYFRDLLPEFENWTDSEIIEFGNDYATMNFYCAMQIASIDRGMLDMLIAINLTQKDMNDLGEVDYFDDNLKNKITKVKNSFFIVDDKSDVELMKSVYKFVKQYSN